MVYSLACVSPFVEIIYFWLHYITSEYHCPKSCLSIRNVLSMIRPSMQLGAYIKQSSINNNFNFILCVLLKLTCCLDSTHYTSKLFCVSRNMMTAEVINILF